MTAVLEPDAPDIGAMTARLFTPPLPHHCKGPALDVDDVMRECPCGCGLNPDTSWGFNCIDFLKNVMSWKLLPYQEWLYIHALEKDDGTGGFRFKILVILISRQQGKTFWLKGLGTWRLFTNNRGRADSDSPGARLAVIAAQNLQYAEGVLKEVVDEIRGNSMLCQELLNHRVCLDVATPLLTTAGWKTMETIGVGDRVYHPDGHPTTVTGVHPIYDDHVCYELTTTDGRTVVCDEDHLWQVRDVRHQAGWERLPTWELMERGLVIRSGMYAFRLPNQKAIISKPIDLPIDPWLLGLWLGDGYKRQAEISVGPQDRDELIANIEAAGAIVVSIRAGTDSVTNRKRSNTMTVRFNIGAAHKDGFMARLRKLGILYSDGKSPQPRLSNTSGYSGVCWLERNKKWIAAITHHGERIYLGLFTDREQAAEAIRIKRLELNNVPVGKHIPDIYLTAGTEQRLALVQGLLDSDGHISKTGQVEFCTKIQQVAESMLYLCRSLGYRPTIITGRATLNGKDYGTKYRVCFSPHAGQLVPFRLKRKAERIRANKSRLDVVSIKSIKPADSRPVRCITVDRDDGLFLAGSNLVSTSNTNGNHRAILTNNRYWRAATASRKGGRSLAVDLAMLDELREHTTTDAYDAIAPTTTVRKYSQIVCTSNAGDARSEVLRALRDPALKRIATGETADTRTGIFEWSVPMEVDPTDDQYWHLANPALGHLNDFSLDDLRGLFEAQQYRNLPGFMTEHLCQWVDALEPGIMPAEHWAETLDNVSRRAEGSKIYAGLDINYERSRSFIAIAARRDDGNLHIEVINGARGTDWVIPWLSAPERIKKFAGVAVQKTGAPASGMVEDLRLAGIPVVEWGPGIEVAGGCGLIYDQITEHKIYHRRAPVLDRAAASGIKRDVGEGWVFDRRNSPVDVSPLIACTAAAWLEHQMPDAPPAIHAWPSEDVIKQWETEGDERWNPAPAEVGDRPVDQIISDSWRAEIENGSWDRLG